MQQAAASDLEVAAEAKGEIRRSTVLRLVV